MRKDFLTEDFFNSPMGRAFAISKQTGEGRHLKIAQLIPKLWSR